MGGVAVVVPTIREACIREFLEAWRGPLREASILVVEDNPRKTFDLGDHSNVTHYAWEDIDAELGERSWIIPRRTDCVRSFGYYKAAQLWPDMIVTLDDDCYPLEGAGDFLGEHWARLSEPARSEAWRSTVQGVVPRGVPYYQRQRETECVLNHGLWAGVPDYDAPTQLLGSREPARCEFVDQTIPVGCYFPMCGMNVAFKPAIAPAFYFLLMGRDHPYDRFGDIWAGVFVKKVCDHLGYAVTSGRPAILHKRASNVWANLRKEAPGLEVNEHLWRAVDRVVLTQRTVAGCYAELAEKLEMDGEYWARLREAMRVWAGLFDEAAGEPRSQQPARVEASAPALLSRARAKAA